MAAQPPLSATPEGLLWIFLDISCRCGGEITQTELDECSAHSAAFCKPNTPRIGGKPVLQRSALAFGLEIRKSINSNVLEAGGAGARGILLSS